MADPQTENGYLKISNELAEAFARTQISGNQWRILWVIIRQTNGWSKDSDRISITQFQQRTGLKRRHVARELNKLIERKIVTKIGNGHSISYRLQRDFSQWESLPKKTPPKIGNENVTKIGAHKRKKDNKDTKGLFFSFLDRYSNRDLIERAFDAIRSTRKSGKVADSVLLKQLEAWGRYPAAQVEGGIRVFLEKSYAGEGKDEKYLLGVIRNFKLGQPHKQQTDFGGTDPRAYQILTFSDEA